jgi:ComF family protein
MSRHFLSRILSVIVPPRESEALVDALTLSDLHSLQTIHGLPYHAQEVQALVWEIKYYGNQRAAALAGELLAEELLEVAGEELGRPLLIPIPMHYSRRSERGHNQTELLCEAAQVHLADAYEYAPQALSRHKLTMEQQKLDRKRRLKNVEGSMQAGPGASRVRGRVCVVVDDVTTTGATCAEATRVLKAAGALRVHCVALAQS